MPPLADVVGLAAGAAARLTGRLARENAQRNPSRTAVTAAALMIGLALVTFVTVFAAGLKSSVAQVVDENFAGGLVIQNTDGFSPIPAGAAVAARAGAGGRIGGDDPLRQGEADRRRRDRRSPRRRRTSKTGSKSNGSGAGPRCCATSATAKRSSPTTSPPTTASERASSFRLLSQTGSAAELQGRRRVRLEGRRLRQRPHHPAGRWPAPSPRPRTRPTSSWSNPAPTPAQVQALLTKGAEAAFPTAEVLNQQELKEDREEQVNKLVTLFYVLLGLAVVISLFGIANTLALSIHERTRELGMLRAIGMSRRQVRTMIRYEAVITALIGAILGMVLGISSPP